MKYYIYKIKNVDTGKMYIGQTNNFKNRINCHCRKSTNSVISKAIQKYGKDNFTFEIIACCISIEDCNFLEEKLIAEYKTLSPLGYNIQFGGSNLKRIKGSMFGKKHNAETKLKMRMASLAVKKTQKTKELMAKSKIGAVLSEETKKKISQSNLGKIRNEKSLYSPQHNLYFKNAKQAYEYLKVSPRTLTRFLDNNSKYYQPSIITYKEN